jgi:hypothetical protein
MTFASHAFGRALSILMLYASLCTASGTSTSGSSEWMFGSQSLLRTWAAGGVTVFQLTIQVEQVRWTQPDGNVETIPARTSEMIARDIDVLNRDFAPAGIGFVVSRVVFINHEFKYDDKCSLYHKALKQAETGNILSKATGAPMAIVKTPDAVDVAYMFGIGPGVAGLANLCHKPGGHVWITGHTNMPQVLSHEMGHHFGLTHTFEEGDDDVSDTPVGPRSFMHLGGPEDPNKDNIMTYSSKDGRTFSPGQIERMRRYACAWLSEEHARGADWNICDPDPDDLLKSIRVSAR